MKLRKFMFVLVSTFTAGLAWAGGTWTNVTVSLFEPSWISGASGYVLAELSGSSTGGPSCASGNKNWVAIDLSTVGGGLLAATIQEARLGGSTITLYGTGSCSGTGYTGGNVETLSQVAE